MQVAYRVAPLTRSPKIRPLFGPPIGELTDARDRDVLARGQKSFGRLLLRPDPLGDVELHSAAECFIAQMRICDLRVRIVRDGHEPNEAEEERPCCVPIDEQLILSSPKDRREQEGYQNSGSPSANTIAAPSAFCDTVPDGETSGTRSSNRSPCAKISVIMPPPCAQAPVKALVPGLLPPYSRQLYSPRTLVLGDAGLT